MMESIKQLKLVTGDEVIARIVEEDDHDVFLRNALGIQFRELEDGSRMYTFKLFMCYQDDSHRMIMMKRDSIVAVANPVTEMLDQYNAACDNIFYGEGGIQWSEDSFDPGQAYDDLMKKLEEGDSAKNNVLPFPPPKIH